MDGGARRVAGGLALGVLMALGLLTAAPAAERQKLRYFKTDAFQVIYLEQRNEYVLPHLTGCFANSFRFYQRFLNFKPSEPVTVLLQDFDDYGYAGATAMPFNYLQIGIEPFEYVYETSPTNERINWVMSHELLHVVASDKAAGRDVTWRKVFFGKVAAVPEDPESMVYSYLTMPRLYAPRWYHEGMAVFMETWMSGGYGRALGGYDEMVFRTMVADGAYFYDTVGLESEGKAIDFQTGEISYLYGTRFVCYLAYLYGPDKLLAWLDRKEGSKPGYRQQFRQVYGADLDAEWQKWIGWEKGWHKANLEAVKQYPVTPFKLLSDRPLGSVSRPYYDAERRTLYTAVNYPGDFARLVAIDVDTWKSRTIAEIETPAMYYVTSLAYDPGSRTLFYSTHNSSQWRGLNKVDVDTGRTTELIKICRTGDLAFDRADRTLWGVMHDNGLSSLVRIASPYTYDDARVVMRLPYGRDMFDLDVSPDGKWLTASIIEVSGRQHLVRMTVADLEAGNTAYEELYEFAGNSPANFVFSPDGKYLYGTSYYSGVSNVFRYDFATRQMDTLTNALTGFFRPLPISEDSLIAFNYTAKGFIPAMLPNRKVEDVAPIRFLGQAIVEKYPVVKDWTLGPPSAIDLDALHPKKGVYNSAGNMGLTSAYPVLQSYRGSTCVGMRLDFMDLAGVDRLDLTATASQGQSVPDDERFHLTANWRHWGWEVSATANRADFYDFFGPTKNSRKGYSLSGGYTGALLFNEQPRNLEYSWRVTGYADLDTLPDYQNVATSAASFVTASGHLGYRHDRKTIGALEPEKGLEWDLDAADSVVKGTHYPRIWGTLAQGFYLPWEHSSVWLHASAGKSWGGREDSLANFYFGGFGNNYVDHGEIRRYRDYDSFPGIDIDAAGGSTYGKLMAEWRLPPLRFRRLGVPQFYCTWGSLTFFSSGLSTNFDRSEFRQNLYNYGAQVDFKIVAFTNLSFTLSIGYARAHRPDLGWSDELMISLKIL